jgi:hypothetical protein
VDLSPPSGKYPRSRASFTLTLARVPAQPRMICANALPPSDPQSAVAPLNAIAYLTAAGNLHNDFSLSADLTLREAAKNRGLFYTDWIILGQLGIGTLPFVQVNLMRWKAFKYRPEVSYTWVGPNGKLIYEDSRIILDEQPHNFAVGARGDRLWFKLDGRELCHGSMRDFFGSNPTLAYQLGGEVVRYGDSIDGTATNIRFKSDADPKPARHTFRCEWVDRGVSWNRIGSDEFKVSGIETKGAYTGAKSVSPPGCGRR